MKIPRADPIAVARFERLRPVDPLVSVRSMFGQPAAFVGGQMFFGVFGADVFVRLSEAHRREAQATEGGRPFEPMAGRPMREYIVLPPTTLDDPRRGSSWVGRSLAYARGLGPKPARPRGTRRSK